jgi:NDP-sugar pyrophosphorylase family protein
MIKNVLIFVGGYGKRLGHLTKKTPKPLLKFNQKPFIEFIFEKIFKIKPKKIILLCRYQNKQFIKKYHNCIINDSKIICVTEKKPLGTAGSLYNAKKYIQDNTLLCNGDSLLDINFEILNKVKLKNSIIFLCLVKNKNYQSNNKLSNLNIKNGKITYNHTSKNKLMNAGVYVLSKKIIKFLKKKSFSLEDEIISKLIKKNLVLGKFYNEYFIDIGTIKNYLIFKKISKKYNYN